MGLPIAEVVEQGDEVGDEVLVPVGPEAGAVRPAGRQIVGDAGELVAAGPQSPG